MSSAAARTPVQRVVRMDEPYSRRARFLSPLSVPAPTGSLPLTRERIRARGFTAAHQ
jgi:hypothetical protein